MEYKQEFTVYPARAHLAIALCGSYIGEILNRYWTVMSVFPPKPFAKPTTKILINTLKFCHKHPNKNPKQVFLPFLNQFKN
jgi:hypothetical protein